MLRATHFSALAVLAASPCHAGDKVSASNHRALPVAAGIVAAASKADLGAARVAISHEATPVQGDQVRLDLSTRQANEYDLREWPAASTDSERRFARVTATADAGDDPWSLQQPRVVTSDDGARYAVGELMANHRRTGPPRSALDAVLVLRIDGNRDSPPLSVGGGLAGVMWDAGTRR